MSDPRGDEPISSDFVLGLLAELRASGYRPAGWVRFLARSWRRSRATARAHPRLVASWARVAASLALGEAAALGLEARRLGRATTRAAPFALLLLAAQQFDVYAHLGMNARRPGEPPYSTLGLPNVLTLARRAISAWLWGHLLAGRPASAAGMRAALLVAAVTDVADGALARWQRRETFLGAYLDAQADASIWTALAFTLAARRLLPRWLLALALARWTVPLALALASYFGAVRRVPLVSTHAGRAAGIVQMAAFAVTLAPERQADMFACIRRPLRAGLAVLLVAVPVSHLLNVIHKRP